MARSRGATPGGERGILLLTVASDPGRYGTPGQVDREVAIVRAIYDAFARRDVEGITHPGERVLLAVVGDELEGQLGGLAK